MRTRIMTFTLALMMTLGIPPAPAAAQAVSVLVDGALVPFDQPPLIMGGRVLIPLRGVFERLGAQVEWQPESRTVIGRRGATMIVLQPGVSSARIGERAVALDVPAMIIGGRTLVPLRFVSEALGAVVDWDAGRRVVYVTSPAAGQPPVLPVAPPVPVVPPSTPQPPPPVIVAPTPTPGPPPPAIIAPPPIIIVPPPPVPAPIQPVPSRIEGTVIRLDAPRSHLYVRSDGLTYRIAVGPGTAIFLANLTTGRSGATRLDAIRRGDLARVSVDAQGRVLTIRASFREVSGRLEDLTARTVRLRDGRSIRLGDDPIFFLDGREVPRDQFRRGMDVELRVNPESGEAWEVHARSIEPTRPLVGQPRIDSIDIGPTRPLGIGETLVVTMRGTPGGTARFEVARLDGEVRMTEESTGTYTGRRTIRSGETVLRAAVTVRLQIAGVEASRVASETVTVDGMPPEITRRSPEPNSIINDPRPAIVVGFADRGPAGIDTGSFRLWINGDEVRRVAVSDTSATYEPSGPLPPGRVRVQARIADRAANEAITEWIFEIQRPPTPTVGPTPPPPPRPTPQRLTPTPTPTPRATPTPPRASPTASPTPSGRVAPPVITEPRAEDAVRTPLVVRGTATAGHKVEVTVEFQGTRSGPVMTIGPATDDVNNNGRWTVRIQLPAPLPRSGQITIIAVAVSPSGARSEPVRLVLTWPREIERP